MIDKEKGKIMRKLSEAEWISRFEQVQGRKPKPDELQLVYQSGLIGISKNYNYIYILLVALVAIVVDIALTLVSTSMKNVKQTKSSATVASSIFSSTEKASAKPGDSSNKNTKSSESSSASIDTLDANHAKEAYTENPRWTDDKASRLASLMVSWGNQMNQPGYKEITNEAFSLPIRWMSDHNQTVDATYAANGNSNSEYTIVSVYERWENISVHRYFFTIKKDGTPFVLYSPTTNGGVYYVKETENADLKSGYADIVNN